ncbi:hypothetical protein IWQ47_000150 [Aquimarina sp. EL_43]|uniref:hypothetical protein n=1 Tax=unclassified Aquimarina TaxID=2627091 RepID=UPI0018CB6630|nr:MULTISPECIES: hypothetical protein [unclassified Aquimarina]MBG6129158.1 hypothetical protein [Aquimarina sp. EL_35]MBG6150223.1 hypothetical protein [Aquimarina sp. EL_32]MBG6167092.1 hypothetical protein [Aquimarina sp. EL_43]
MSSTKQSEIQQDLVLYSTFDDKITVTLKSKIHKPFVTQVKGFNYKEEDPRVIFKHCEESIFPTDTEDNKEKEYIVYIKNIKSVELYEMNHQ